MTAAAIELSGHAGPVAVPAEALDELAARVGGRLLRPGDPGWDEAVLLWNGAAARSPALVVQPASAAEVAAAVRFARDHGAAWASRAAATTSPGPPSPRAA
jgi:FAD/FMN-containing dehydrogenase